MADIEFKVTGGPYAGDYSLDMGDITANDVGDLIAQGGPDLDIVITGEGGKGLRMFAGFVWIVRRRHNKGLAYRMVADSITFDVIQPATSGESAEKSLDPSDSANA